MAATELESRVAVLEEKFAALRHDHKNQKMISQGTAEMVQEIRSEVIRLRTRVYAVASTLLVTGAVLGWAVELGVRS